MGLWMLCHDRFLDYGVICVTSETQKVIIVRAISLMSAHERDKFCVKFSHYEE